MHSSNGPVHLMAAKICHDIATPLSAMNLLVDIAFEHCQDPHIEATFRESIEKTSLRLQFYRLLLAVNQEQPSYSDVRAILEACCKSAKVRLTLPNEFPNGVLARLLLGLTYLSIEALTRGGVVVVEYQSQALRIAAEGTPLNLRPGYMDALREPEKMESNARTIFPLYLAGLAQELLVVLEPALKDDCLEIIVRDRQS